MSTKILDAIMTPCLNPDCAHRAEYGAAFCCEPFRAQVQDWTQAEASRLLATLPDDCGAVWKDRRDGIHWSGGAASLPSASIQRHAAGGWHNGCHYGGQETYPGAYTTMPGFTEITREIG